MGLAERALARLRGDGSCKNMETLRRLMDEARLETSFTEAGEPAEALSVETNQPLGFSPSPCLTGFHVPNSTQSLAKGRMQQQCSIPTDRSLEYLGVEETLLHSAYNGVGWNGSHISVGAADGAFDDGDTFFCPDETSAVPPLSRIQ